MQKSKAKKSPKKTLKTRKANQGKKVPLGHKDVSSMSKARVLSQFFTNDDIAAKVVQITKDYLTKQNKVWNQLFFIEPSAGDAAIFKLLPTNRRIGVEVDPDLVKKHPYYLQTDVKDGGFLSIGPKELQVSNIPKDSVVVIGNPPYNEVRTKGRSAVLPVEFINHASEFADTVAFIMGTTFRRPSTQNKIAQHMHLVYDMDLPDVSFTLNGKPHKVLSIFQIWRAKYDKNKKPIARQPDPVLKLLHKGHWDPKDSWYYVGPYDNSANVAIRNWGSLDRIGQLFNATETKTKVQENQAKLEERKKSGKAVKGFDPSPSFYYIHAKNPKETLLKFTENHHLFKKLGRSRGLCNSHDLTHADIALIYMGTSDTDFKNGQWVNHPFYSK